MKRPFAKIEENLANILDQQLLAQIYEFRNKRLTEISDIIKKMSESQSDLSGKEAVQKAVACGLEQLKNFSSANDYESIHDLIVKNIFVLKDELPNRLVFKQLPRRFKMQPDDAIYIKAAKGGKQLLKSLGKSEWMQKVPFQNVVVYHLLDEQWFFKDWLAAEERLLMQIFLEMDQVLFNTTKSQSSDSELQQLLKVVQNQIEEARRAQKDKLVEARDALIGQIVTTISKVGTVEQRSGFYTANRLQTKRKETRKEMQAYQEEWQSINSRLFERTAALHRFLGFCDNIEQATITFKKDINRVFDRIFFTPLRALEDQVSLVGQHMDRSEKTLFSDSTTGEEEFSANIDVHFLQPIRENIEKTNIENKVESYAERLKQQAGELEETVRFISDIDRSVDPPKVKSREIQWRVLIIRNLQGKLLEKITLDNDSIHAFGEEQLQRGREIKSILEANLESAVELSKNNSQKEKPHDVLDDALVRVLSKIDKSEHEAIEKKQSFLETLDEGLKEFRKSMFELLHSGKTDRLQTLEAQHKVQEKAGKLKDKADSSISGTRSRASVLRRFFSLKAKNYARSASIFLGLKKEEIQEEKKADITAFLNTTEHRMEELPYIYRQLFSIKDIPDQRFYVGVNENFAAMRQTYEKWTAGHPAACALIGEKGSGKSTYFSLVNQELFTEAEVWHIRLNKTCWTKAALLDLFKEWINPDKIQSVEELISFINSRKERTVILFEDIHKLYLRQLNGYEGIEQLIYLISETKDHVFWVIGCSRYAWAFLDKAAELEGHFSQIIDTDALDEKQIKNVILSRHRSSGYELVFEAEEGAAGNKKKSKTKDDEEKQQELKEKYFDALTDIAEGNASIAMIFWVRSIREFDDTHFYIAPLETASVKMLDDLQPTTLFVLAALVLHDALTSAELSSILGIPERESKMIFNRLKARGILVAKDNRMSLNQLIYRQTIRELKERNILHLV